MENNGERIDWSKLAEDISATESGHDSLIDPFHYRAHPSGVECIEITEHMNFCLGNAMKYIWRADLKGDDIGDLQKAVWYLEREIERRNTSVL